MFVLVSSHLPVYLVAAFAKRLARLALTAPPTALLIVLPFIYNLIRRHPSCRVLIHKPSSEDGESHLSLWLIGSTLNFKLLLLEAMYKNVVYCAQCSLNTTKVQLLIIVVPVHIDRASWRSVCDERSGSSSLSCLREQLVGN